MKFQHYITVWVGSTMFGTYNLINMIVIINVLIAMMNNSYQFISDHADIGLAHLWSYHMVARWYNSERIFRNGTLFNTQVNLSSFNKSLVLITG